MNNSCCRCLQEIDDRGTMLLINRADQDNVGKRILCSSCHDALLLWVEEHPAKFPAPETLNWTWGQHYQIFHSHLFPGKDNQSKTTRCGSVIVAPYADSLEYIWNASEPKARCPQCSELEDLDKRVYPW